MICRQVWDYAEESHVATLTGFALLCRACDAVHHIGLAGIHGRASAAIDHMARINGTDRAMAEREIGLTFSSWKRRSARKWTIHISADVATLYPVLGQLEGLTGHPGDGRQRALSVSIP